MPPLRREPAFPTHSGLSRCLNSGCLLPHFQELRTREQCDSHLNSSLSNHGWKSTSTIWILPGRLSPHSLQPLPPLHSHHFPGATHQWGRLMICPRSRCHPDDGFRDEFSDASQSADALLSALALLLEIAPVSTNRRRFADCESSGPDASCIREFRSLKEKESPSVCPSSLIR
jgi:hypothetical protein